MGANNYTQKWIRPIIGVQHGHSHYLLIRNKSNSDKTAIALKLRLDCTENRRRLCLAFFLVPCPEFSKFCFKTRTYSTIHTFKNYFTTMFLAISKIQTDQLCHPTDHIFVDPNPYMIILFQRMV